METKSSRSGTGSSARMASVSAPELVRNHEDSPPSPLLQKNSKGASNKRPSITGVVAATEAIGSGSGNGGSKFYAEYADRVVAPIPPKSKSVLAAELMSELKAKRQEVKTLQSANRVLTKRLQISEKQLEEMDKTKHDAAFIETKRILMSLQSHEQGTREALKWGFESALRTFHMGFLLDKPYTFVVTPPTQELQVTSPDQATKVEKLKSDLQQERLSNRTLQQSVEHEKATLHAQYEMKVSELETENFKLTVQKRLDDVELNQSCQRLLEIRQEGERHVEKIDDLHLQVKYLKERLRVSRVPENPDEEEIAPVRQVCELTAPPPASKKEKRAIRNLQVSSDLRSHTAPAIAPPRPNGFSNTQAAPRSSRKVGRSPDRISRKVSASPGSGVCNYSLFSFVVVG